MTTALSRRLSFLLCLLLFSGHVRAYNAYSYNDNSYGNNGYNSNNYNNGNYNSNNYGNGNYGSNGYSSSSSSSSNNNNQADGIKLNVCANSVVQVKSVTIGCSSPYTFYYGNGAHRNSMYCDYLDKATVQVQFQVIDNIEEENDIYMTMAIYDKRSNLLAVIDPSYLCNDYVGSSCTNAGYYSFTTKVRLESPDNRQSGSSDSFVPQIQMAFSTKPNHGYNLGALNTECKKWNSNEPDYVSWKKHKRASGSRLFWQRNGALLGTCLILTSVIAFVWTQSNRNSALFHLESVYGKGGTPSMPLVA